MSKISFFPFFNFTVLLTEVSEAPRTLVDKSTDALNE